MTQLVKKMRLEGQIEKNKSEYLKSYTSTMSHEFRTPLGTSLMFLEDLMKDEELKPSVLNTLNVIFSQLTFLLSLVNCVLDMKMVESGDFQPILEQFDPVAVLTFIIAIFKPLSELQKTKIEYETVEADDLEDDLTHDYDKMMLTHQQLPSLLLGD